MEPRTTDSTQDRTDNASVRYNRVALRTFLSVLAVGCILLALTRPSWGASVMVLVSVMLALGSLAIRQVRGEIVVLLLVFGAPFVAFFVYLLFAMHWF